MSDPQLLRQLGPREAILAVIDRRGGRLSCRAITDALVGNGYRWPTGRGYPDYGRVFRHLVRLAAEGQVVRVESIDGALWGRP